MNGFRVAVTATGVLVATMSELALAASIVVAPAPVTMPVASSRSFTATVSGLPSTAVSWEVNGKPNGSSQLGTITSAGVYTAPAAISTAPATFTVTARAVADSSVAGSSTVTVRYPVPWLTVVTPSSLPAGNPFTLDINGSRFAPGAQAFLNTTALATTWISDTKLSATGTLDPTLVGALSFRVENPGGVSSTTLPMVGVPSIGPGQVNADTVAAARFLEQASFGPTDQGISDVQQVGIDNWIAMQMDPAITPPSLVPDGLSVPEVQAQWIRQMASGPDQLRQRMAFALSQIFVVSRFKNTNGEELSPWVRLLVGDAFGNFRTLLQDVTLSPTMGKFLDLVNSKRPAANENYARELMQLFSIGTYKLDQDGLATLDANGDTIDTYNQDVVRNMSLAMTGWVYAPAPGKASTVYNSPNFTAPMVPLQASHDMTQKTIFNGIVIPGGMNAAAEMSLVLDKLFMHANVPPFFATRLIRFFVTSNPSPAYVKRVADVFVDNGSGVRGDMAAVLKAVLTDAEARPATPGGTAGRLKDPMLQMLDVVRALGGQVNDATQILYLLNNLGEDPLDARSVFSFYSPLAPLPKHPLLYGPEFQIYAPALAIQRANFLFQLLGGQFGSAITVDTTPFQIAAPSPTSLVNLVDAKLFHGTMSLPLRQAILMDCNAVTDSKQRAIGALFMAATSSEFAVVR